jgi:Kef-type K+ transport system membrane component KefB
MEDGTEAITKLVFQLAAILVAAKLGGELFERYLKLPSVLGELAAGMVIGPFALGAIDIGPLAAGAINIPQLGPLFEDPAMAGAVGEGFTIPISESLWSFAQVGAIVLLFTAGLETDLRQFLRYARPASVVAIGGVVLPFASGVVLTVAFGFAESFTDVKALFVGAVLTATSIGITVRVLGDLRRLATPEGVTILGAAVLDDVVGILVLTIVVGIHTTGEFSASSVGLVALKTFGFWIGLTGLGILFSRHISNLFEKFQVSGAALALALALAFLAAALAESFGLAMIIGAFSIGLALSGTELAERLDAPLKAVYAMLVPVFFVVMGMLVDVTAMGGVWTFGLVITIFAVIGKIAGSGLPALLVGFNRRGAWRIGVGMLPRGEVALIMAGIGVSSGVLGADLYSVTIMMTIGTTALAPAVLALSFKGDTSGLRAQTQAEEA